MVGFADQTRASARWSPVVRTGIGPWCFIWAGVRTTIGQLSTLRAFGTDQDRTFAPSRDRFGTDWDRTSGWVFRGPRPTKRHYDQPTINMPDGNPPIKGPVSSGIHIDVRLGHLYTETRANFTVIRFVFVVCTMPYVPVRIRRSPSYLMGHHDL